MKLINLNAIILTICVVSVIADDCARVSWTSGDLSKAEIGYGAVEHCPGKDPEGSGFHLECTPFPCMKDEGCDTCCVVGKRWEEGCCIGPPVNDNCPVEQQCGEFCPNTEDLCTAPEGCENSSCVTCDLDSQGEEIWKINDVFQDFDCINTGYKTRVVDGGDVDVDRQELTYKWAIICGPMVSGKTTDTNYGPGQYACGAFRSGAGLTHDDSLVAALLPALWIQLGECGCGPADMATFGLPDPTGPCVTEDDCIFLAHDAPGDVAKNLCHSFDKFSNEEGFQGIDWWEEPINFLGADIFASSAPSVGEITINVVKEVDSASTHASLYFVVPIIMTYIISQLLV